MAFYETRPSAIRGDVRPNINDGLRHCAVFADLHRKYGCVGATFAPEGVSMRMADGTVRRVDLAAEIAAVDAELERRERPVVIYRERPSLRDRYLEQKCLEKEIGKDIARARLRADEEMRENARKRS